MPGEIPTLGYGVIDWMADELNAPDDPDGSPLTLTREQEDFILGWYAIDPDTGRFLRRRGLIGRPRGWGKSPFLGAVALAEGLGDVLFDGWDADGQPVGKPWAATRVPLIHVAAVSETQTKNTWDAILNMLEGSPALTDYRGLEPMETFINFPVGQMQRITSADRTAKGARSVFAVLDQTEEWVRSNRGLALAQTIRTNCAKVGGRTLESPNAYIPGEGSVAEESAEYAKKIAEGRTRLADLLYDHREAPADTDLTDRESIVAGLRHAYGCSSDHPDGCVLHDPPCKPGWAPIESNADMFWDPANDVQKLRSDFLNQVTHASDAWVTRPAWNACSREIKEDVAPPARGDVIVLGFDGSRKRTRGMTDATALVAVRVSDGYVWPLGIWEEPDGPASDDWQIPVDDVNRVVDETFADYRVVGFYADPSKWRSHVAKWEAKYGSRLRVPASRSNPIEWWMSGGLNRAKVTKSLEAFRGAILDREVTHSDSSVLSRHILNARRRTNSSGYGIYKAHPDSADKIDGAVAATLAWQARLDAISAGVAQVRRKRRQPRRLY